MTLGFGNFLIKLFLDFLENSQALRSSTCGGFNNFVENDLELGSESEQVFCNLRFRSECNSSFTA